MLSAAWSGWVSQLLHSPPTPSDLPSCFQHPWCQKEVVSQVVISNGLSWTWGFTWAGGGCGKALRCNQTTTPLPLPQILELNKRMSAMEHLLVHLENAVLPPSAQVIPWTRRGLREAEVPRIASRGDQDLRDLAAGWCSVLQGWVDEASCIATHVPSVANNEVWSFSGRCPISCCEMNPQPDVDIMGAETGPASPACTSSLKKFLTFTPLPHPQVKHSPRQVSSSQSLVVTSFSHSSLPALHDPTSFQVITPLTVSVAQVHHGREWLQAFKKWQPSGVQSPSEICIWAFLNFFLYQPKRIATLGPSKISSKAKRWVPTQSASLDLNSRRPATDHGTTESPHAATFSFHHQQCSATCHWPVRDWSLLQK